MVPPHVAQVHLTPSGWGTQHARTFMLKYGLAQHTYTHTTPTCMGHISSIQYLTMSPKPPQSHADRSPNIHLHVYPNTGTCMLSTPTPLLSALDTHRPYPSHHERHVIKLIRYVTKCTNKYQHDPPHPSGVAHHVAPFLTMLPQPPQSNTNRTPNTPV